MILSIYQSRSSGGNRADRISCRFGQPAPPSGWERASKPRNTLRSSEARAVGLKSVHGGRRKSCPKGPPLTHRVPKPPSNGADIQSDRGLGFDAI